MESKRIYRILTLSSLAGYAWLAYQLFFTNKESVGINACPIKLVSGIPCPSCGSTRSVLSIINGHFAEAIYFNPLGYIVLIILLIIPMGLVYDSFSKTTFLIESYRKTESTLRKKYVAALLILLIISNWIWNIYKYS